MSSYLQKIVLIESIFLNLKTLQWFYFFFFSSLSHYHGDVVVQAPGQGQLNSAAVAAELLYNPANSSATHDHALSYTITIPIFPVPNISWAPNPVGRTPTEAQ